MSIFITGINQGCGKTIIASGITAVMQSLGYRTGVYKPIQTGAIDKGNYLISPDLDFVAKLDPNITTHSTYLLTSECTPAAAAEIERVKISIDDIINDYNILVKNTEVLVVEGTGGLLTPLKENLFNIHIPLMLKIPVIFIVTPSNDSLNTFLNELNTAYKAGLDIIGVIVNKYPLQSKNSEITSFISVLEKYGNIKVLGVIRYFKDKIFKTDELFTEILNSIDLKEILRMEIPKLSFDY